MDEFGVEIETLKILAKQGDFASFSALCEGIKKLPNSWRAIERVPPILINEYFFEHTRTPPSNIAVSYVAWFSRHKDWHSNAIRDCADQMRLEHIVRSVSARLEADVGWCPKKAERKGVSEKGSE